MKTLIATVASLAALASVTTAASAGGHRHHHHHRSFYGFSSYAPVYVAPKYACKWVYHHGHSEKVCFRVRSYH